jgi:hypothetical protein
VSRKPTSATVGLSASADIDGRERGTIASCHDIG